MGQRARRERPRTHTTAPHPHFQERIPCPSPPRGRTLPLTSGARVAPPDPDAGPRPPVPLASGSNARARAAQFPEPGSAGRLKGAARRPASADRKAGSARAGPWRGSAAVRSGLPPTRHENTQLLGSAAPSVQPGGASEGLAHPDLRNLPPSTQEVRPERQRLPRSRAAPSAERRAGRSAPRRPAPKELWGPGKGWGPEEPQFQREMPEFVEALVRGSLSTCCVPGAAGHGPSK